MSEELSKTEQSGNPPKRSGINRYVAQQIRAARKTCSLTQVEIAERVGCTQTAISYWESGERAVGLEELMDLAVALGQSLEFFLPPRQPPREMVAADSPQSEFISNIGPDFYVGGEKKRLSFRRIIDGPEQGGVVVDLEIDGELHHAMTIDAAGWASVLAHVSAAEHDGTTFAIAEDLHAGKLKAALTNLAKAGALIAAEIDRLQRAAALSESEASDG